MINSSDNRRALCILSLIFTLVFQNGDCISDKKTKPCSVSSKSLN